MSDMADHLMPDERTQKDREMDSTTLLLHGTDDAMVWAKEWCRIAREIEARGESLVDEGWMVGWFANAMEIAVAHNARRILALADEYERLASPAVVDIGSPPLPPHAVTS
jgi:MarR-like DNA-binding transcriptional regulator SgrR of sgrS sRNA